MDGYVPLPAFYGDKPALWFAQVEAVFALNGITSDQDKYNYTIVHIKGEVAQIVADVILNPPADEKYHTLKTELIKRLSISQLKRERLDNKKPSEFLRHLLKVADRRLTHEDVRGIWFSLLPSYVRDIVALETSNNTQVLSDMADKIIEIIPSATQTSTEIVHKETFYGSNICKRLDEITAKIERLKMDLEVKLCIRCKKVLGRGSIKRNIEF